MSEKAFEYAICVKNHNYPASLALHKVYRVIPDEEAAADGDIRIIDESGEDYLYPAGYFILFSLPEKTARLLHDSFVTYSTDP